MAYGRLVRLRIEEVHQHQSSHRVLVTTITALDTISNQKCPRLFSSSNEKIQLVHFSSRKLLKCRTWRTLITRIRRWTVVLSTPASSSGWTRPTKRSGIAARFEFFDSDWKVEQKRKRCLTTLEFISNLPSFIWKFVASWRLKAGVRMLCIVL